MISKNTLPLTNGLLNLVFVSSIFLSTASAEVLNITVPFMGPGGDYVTTQDRYHTFRIPGMIVAQDGTILAFAEGRRGDGDDPRIDENAPGDIVLRRSTDLGKTWEPLVVIESGFRPDGKLADFGDPTPVLDETTGTIFLFYGQWPDHGPRISSLGQSTDPDEGNQTLWVRESNDHGKSWSDRRQLIYPDTPDKTSDGLYWRYAEPGPGNGIQLRWQPQESRNGRLIVPMKRAASQTPDGEPQVASFVYYSDDHGKTWQISSLATGPDGDEDEVVELTDGRVLLDSRQQEGDFRTRYLSQDGGKTWGANQYDTIPLAQVDGSLARYSSQRDGHDRNRILFSAPRGKDGLNRNQITVWTSYDEGQSFENPVTFNEDFAAYSVVARLPDGTIGLLVETGGDADDKYGAITFYRFDLAELEAKK